MVLLPSYHFMKRERFRNISLYLEVILLRFLIRTGEGGSGTFEGCRLIILILFLGVRLMILSLLPLRMTAKWVDIY